MSDTTARIEETKNALIAEKNLTPLEFQFIHDLSCSDFAFECGREDGIGGYVSAEEGYDMSRVRGVMSSLIKKGYLNIDDASFIAIGEGPIKMTWACVTDQDITDAIYYMWYPEVA